MTEQSGGDIPNSTEQQAKTPTEATTGFLSSMKEDGSAKLATLLGTTAGANAVLATNFFALGLPAAGLSFGVSAVALGVVAISEAIRTDKKNR